VVASLLRAARGALELVDASGQLPELPRAPGLRNWQVIDDAMRRVPSLASLSSEPLTVRRRFRAGMFPPKGGGASPTPPLVLPAPCAPPTPGRTPPC